jgi:PAS domain S-box-containing protein
MQWHWSQLKFRTKLSLFALGIVLLSTLGSAVGAISLNFHQTRLRNAARLHIAVSAIQRRVEQVATELDQRYAALARNEQFNDAILAVITGPYFTFRMIPAVRQLGPELELERFAFYCPQTFPGPVTLQLYYDRALGGIVQVKGDQHLLCPAGSFVDQPLADPHLFPPTPDTLPPCALVVHRGQLHWLARYEFRRCADTMTGNDKIRLGEQIGTFVMQLPALKLDLASLGEETGVRFAVYDAQGRRLAGQLDLADAITGSYGAVTVLKSPTGEAFDTFGQSIEHDGRLAGFVLATISQTATAHQNWRMVGLLLVIAAGVSVLIVLLSWRVVAHVIRPVQALTRASAEIAAGQLDGHIETGGQDEFGVLARSFDAMRAAVKDQIAQSARLTAIIEGSPSLVLTMAPDGQLTYLNATGRKMLGWPATATLAGRRLADNLPPDVQELLQQRAMPRALQTGLWQGEARLLGADRRELPVQATLMAHYGPMGQVEYFSCLLRDLSGAKQAEAALRASEEYLAITLNSIGDAVISTDLQGLVMRINRVAQELTGWPQTEALGRPLNEILMLRNPETRAPVESLVDRVQRAGAPVATAQPVLLIARDGVERLIADSAAPIREERDQQPLGVVIVFRDVTRQQQMETQLLQAQKMESIGALAGGVAHDFNNMLGGITSAAELLGLELADHATARQYVDLILRTTTRAADLTQKLLAFSRKGKVLAVPLDIHRCIEDALALLERSVDRRIKLVRELQAQNAIITGDAAQIQNIMLNLGLNARDAMPEGGTLTIATRNTQLDLAYCAASPFKLQPGLYIQVSVRDTGIGMTPEVLRRLFEPFFTTKPTGKGTGLGLAAVYGAVRGHNGAITVASEPGAGAVFHVYLPVAANATPPRPAAREDIVLGFGTVLLVDDEEVIRQTASLMLKALGYQVLLATNGREGVEQYRKNMGRINIVLLDMVMPEMNGVACFREIRKLDPRARVIISSGFARDADLTQLLVEGLAGFIQKPYRRVELSRELGRVLHKPA